MRFSIKSYTTDIMDLETGIAMDSTISPIFLVFAMEVIFNAAEGTASLKSGW